MRYLLTGDEFDAAEALRMRLVNEVVAAERVLPRAIELAERLPGCAAGDPGDLAIGIPGARCRRRCCAGEVDANAAAADSQCRCDRRRDGDVAEAPAGVQGMLRPAMDDAGKTSGEPVTLIAADGYRLGATLFPAANGKVRAHLLMAGATGVPQGFYRRFAEYASQRGFSVLTLDYRGVGQSRPASLRGFRMSHLDWGRLDLAAAVDALHSERVPLYLVGHSFGGHALGLLPNHRRISACYSFGSGAGWAGWDAAAGGHQGAPAVAPDPAAAGGMEGLHAVAPARHGRGSAAQRLPRLEEMVPLSALFLR